MSVAMVITIVTMASCVYTKLRVNSYDISVIHVIIDIYYILVVVEY